VSPRRSPLGRVLGGLLTILHAATVPMLPTLAAIGFLVRLGTGWRDARLDWLPLWAPWFVPLLLQPLLGGHWQEAAALGAHVAFGLALSVGGRLPDASIVIGGTVAVVMLAGLVGVDRWESARSWYALAEGAVQQIGIGPAGGIDRVNGGGTDRAARTWRLDGPVTGLEGSISLRLAPRDLPVAGAAIGLEIHALVSVGDRTHRLVQPLDATREWTEQPFSFEHGALALAPFVQLRLSVPDGAAIEVRLTRLEAQDGVGTVRPLPTRPRTRLWFEHFNLLGHTAAMWVVVVLTVAALRRSRSAYLLTLIAGVAITVASGSRAATLAVVLAVAMHVFTHGRVPGSRSPARTRSWAGWWFLGFAGMAAAAALAVTFAIRPVDGFGPSRLAAWTVAASAIVEHPLNGASLPFGSAFAQAHPEFGVDAVTHAHNLWLDAGYRYGVFGLLAMGWLVGGMARLAWRHSGWHGLAIVVPFVAMQTFDVTLWYVGVLVALVIGVNIRVELE
jgi:hypothetical protein